MNGKPFNVSIRELREGDRLNGDPSNLFAPPAAFGRFRVLHQVGAGVLGPVFRGHDPETDRLVAIKVFRLDITPERAAELAAELQSLVEAGFTHPGLVMLAGAGIEGSLPYLAQDYVPADSLDAALRQYGPAPVPQAMGLLTQLAGALDFAGAMGVHHGSLHPRDILVAPADSRLTGIGIAEALDRVGLHPAPRRAYAAPERLEGAKPARPGDIYSLAIVAHELLTSRRPMLVDDGLTLRLSGLPAGSAELERVFRVALAVRPDERFPTALEFINAMQDVFQASRSEPVQESRAAGPIEAVTEQAPPPARQGREARGPSLPFDAGLAGAEGEEDAERPTLVLPIEPHDGTAGETAHDELAADLGAIDRFAPEAPSVPQIDLGALPVAAPSAGVPAEAEGPEPPIALNEVEPAERPRVETRAKEAPATVERAVEPHPEVSRAVLPPPPSADAGPLPTRRRVSGLPLLLMLLMGLLVGFIGGYLIGVSRKIPAGELPRVPQVATEQPAAGPVAKPVPRTPSPLPSSPPAATGSAGTMAAAQPLRQPAPAAQASSSTGGANRTQTAVAAQPPATRPPARAGSAFVLRSTPPGARVSVNGQDRGETPLTLRDLAPGRYRLRLSHAGYVTDDREIVLPRDRPLLVRLQQREAQKPAAPAPPTASAVEFFGALSVDSLPPGAAVFVDGQLMGKTPIVLPRVAAGAHVVRLDLSGYRRWSTAVQVSAGDRTRVAGSLEPEQFR